MPKRLKTILIIAGAVVLIVLGIWLLEARSGESQGAIFGPPTMSEMVNKARKDAGKQPLENTAALNAEADMLVREIMDDKHSQQSNENFAGCFPDDQGAFNAWMETWDTTRYKDNILGDYTAFGYGKISYKDNCTYRLLIFKKGTSNE